VKESGMYMWKKLCEKLCEKFRRYRKKRFLDKLHTFKDGVTGRHVEERIQRLKENETLSPKDKGREKSER
jgi:hypothetical protein